MIYNFFIINSSGSMIYSYQKEKILHKNQLLVLCSTLHSIHSMLQTEIYAYYEKKLISIYKTHSDLLFVFISDSKNRDMFIKVYSEYCKYVKLNPFYITDMPINCKKFNPFK